ncbi:hypothetical protein PA10_00279 [Pseudomonas phage pPa_SNUABM_DT01]|nr:hypothetical protein PA10_00279 [Pseudomonas phage pPa_SNUABM_DT01]
MSKGKYVIPVILGQPGSELYLVKGDLPPRQGMALVRLTGERQLNAKDEKELDKLIERMGPPKNRPARLTELTFLNDTVITLVDQHEATLVQGYINNTLPGAFRAPELNNWYIFERQGDLTPLKLARFAINLLERSQRMELLGNLSGKSVSFTHYKYDNFR